jgi:ABC-type sulfate transport system permease component
MVEWFFYALVLLAIGLCVLAIVRIWKTRKTTFNYDDWSGP